MCRERHPKTCKFYLRKGGCKWKEDCAYLHQKSSSDITIDILESEVKKLKDDVKQLTNNMSEMMIKMITLEESYNRYDSEHLNDATKEDLQNIGVSNKGASNCDQCNTSNDTNSGKKTLK